MGEVSNTAYTGRVIVTYLLNGKRYRSVWDCNFHKKAVEESLIKRGATNICFYNEKVK